MSRSGNPERARRQAQAAGGPRRLPWSWVAGALLVASPVAWAQEKITVIVPDVQPAGQEYYKNVVVPAFEKETGIQVDLQLTSWGGYVEKLKTMVAGGLAPDVIQVGGESVGSFVMDGLIRPLNTWTDRWPALNDFPKPALLDGTVNGRLYTVPYRLDQRPLLYRIDFFEEAGLDSRRPPATWEELVQAARKLVRLNDQGQIQRAGFDTHGAADLVGAFIYQNGGRLVSPDGKKAEFNSPRAVEAVEFIYDLIHTYRVGFLTGAPWENADPIVTGRAAMRFAGDWTLGMMERFDQKNADALGVALPPGRVTRSGWLNVNKWAITAASKNPNAAWKWIEFVSRPDVLAGLSRVNSFLPPRKTVVAGEPWSRDPRWGVFMRSAEETVPIPANAYNFGQVLAELSKAANSVLKQEKPARAALDEAAQRATQALTLAR